MHKRRVGGAGFAIVIAAAAAATAALGPGCSSDAPAGNPDSGGGDANNNPNDANLTPDVDAGPIVAPQPVSPYIVVDQLGYRTGAEKIAVLRSPQTGFDAKPSATPGATFAVIDAHTSQKLFEGAPTPWNGGATDPSSGDKAWAFDFSSVTAVGDYFVLDEANAVRSVVFHVADDVYRGVLAAAVKMLYYQRDGIAKDAQFAGASWADGMAHAQDTQCGLYTNGTAPKDLHGGWFDAGDQNRYTSWGASDVIELLHAYMENPSAFRDDYVIPESGNGVADVLDEAKWELDWMARMQNADGSVLSIAGHAGASPPSTDASPCKYGPATTAASLTTAAAFAYASIVFAQAPGAAAAYPGFAADLATRAQSAWTWANANTNVTFFNSQNGVGAGEQEVDTTGRAQKKVQAAVFLFELTGNATYKTAVDAGYASLQSSVDPFHMEQLDTLLEYTKATGATANVVSSITSTFKTQVEGNNYFGNMDPPADPYLSWLQVYTWGSNQVKAGQGNMFADISAFGLDSAASATGLRYAERYVHYMHGVNPLQLVYLSNMAGAGAESSVTRFYHTWFAKGTDWDTVGVSKYGPPPGYLVGGPNPSYSWDGCCPSGCGSAQNNAACGSAPLSPPAGQPDQKSYLDFNDSWPLDSWAISEPDDGYQAQYIRLVSKFVE